jgi:hypothetical protein
MQYFTNKKLYVGLVALFFLSSAAILVAAYMFVSLDQQKKVDTTNTAVLMAHVGKLVDLPDGEKPQVVPITDVTSFKNEPFFYFAKEGDVLIVYLQKHVAILYDPKENKIVNMSKVSAVIPAPPAL